MLFFLKFRNNISICRVLREEQKNKWILSIIYIFKFCGELTLGQNFISLAKTNFEIFLSNIYNKLNRITRIWWIWAQLFFVATFSWYTFWKFCASFYPELCVHCQLKFFFRHEFIISSDSKMVFLDQLFN